MYVKKLVKDINLISGDDVGYRNLVKRYPKYFDIIAKCAREHLCWRQALREVQIQEIRDEEGMN